MWYRVSATHSWVDEKGKTRSAYETYLSDAENFAEAGYNVMKHVPDDCEIEVVSLEKNLKPLGNEKHSENDKLFIVKVAADYKQDDGTIKTLKYPIPFYAFNTDELQVEVKNYMEQGLEDMRITTISETKWEIV